MIIVVKAKNVLEGNLNAHKILLKIVDSQTLLALSGGSTPDYRKMLVEPDDVIPGAICVVDERYGESFHKNSNELILKKQGVKDWADKHCIESKKILSGGTFKKTAMNYNLVINRLFVEFPKRVAVMGIGANFHTAGIFANSKALNSNKLVTFEEVDDQFPKRITMTFKALNQFQYFVILAFGSEKQETLLKILDKKENELYRYPAIFYRKTRAKCWLISDLKL